MWGPPFIIHFSRILFINHPFPSFQETPTSLPSRKVQLIVLLREGRLSTCRGAHGWRCSWCFLYVTLQGGGPPDIDIDIYIPMDPNTV